MGVTLVRCKVAEVKLYGESRSYSFFGATVWSLELEWRVLSCLSGSCSAAVACHGSRCTRCRLRLRWLRAALHGSC
jgi:hypothetical protein